MLNALLEQIKSVAVFMIVCQAIVHFVPSKNYGRYIKPLVGFMILSKILISIFGGMGNEFGKEMENSIQEFEAALSEYENQENQDLFQTADFPVKEQKDELFNEDLTIKINLQIQPVTVQKVE